MLVFDGGIKLKFLFESSESKYGIAIWKKALYEYYMIIYEEDDGFENVTIEDIYLYTGIHGTLVSKIAKILWQYMMDTDEKFCIYLNEEIKEKFSCSGFMTKMNENVIKKWLKELDSIEGN